MEIYFNNSWNNKRALDRLDHFVSFAVKNPETIVIERDKDFTEKSRQKVCVLTLFLTSVDRFNVIETIQVLFYFSMILLNQLPFLPAKEASILTE